MKSCIACGMPMEKPEDYAMGDESKAYCRYCSREDGSMQNYEEKLESMTQFIVRTQGLARATAQDSAEEMLSRLPAWKDRPGRN